VALRETFRLYYELTKPGIIRGNLMTAAAGFLLASKGTVDLLLLAATAAGVALIVACGCVLNNYIDRDIDQKMTRTNKRAIATGAISGRTALAYATLLGLLGFAALAFTNALTMLVGATGLVFYVVVYGYWKRRSTLGTVVGSISGAVPPVAGYAAVTGQLDMGAFLLFALLACWQMPHFYAIAMYRYNDYAAAAIPVLPVKKGMRVTKYYILAYIAAFTGIASLLTVAGYTGYTYLAVVLVSGTAWFIKGLAGLRSPHDKRWARGMFFFSLLVVTAVSAALALEAFLP
jgi:protoheme IX farnesyltransferase